ncbi:uncharacterized protein LOC115804742 [Chanos chanos]|uniref:Uncharacterized protein LOC115804742 n=1 Tax=Chanos chanos TaxID=29144 RepID=A0A6J2UM18_CHACN|nr:uncharacterized protein LOC115804742 [Chanos chanos]
METSRSNSQFVYKLSDEDTTRLIKLRAANEALFTGRRNAAKLGWRAILKEMGLEKQLSTDQASKKWDNMKNKYKEMRYLPPETASCWQWFPLMHEALEGRLAGSAPVLSTSSLGNDEEFAPTAVKKARRSQGRVDGLDFLGKMDEGTEAEVVLRDRTVMSSEGSPSESDTALNGRVTMEKNEFASDRLRDSLEMERITLRRDRQLLEREQAELDRERMMLERERGLIERERAVIERDRALLEKDRAAVDRERASVDHEQAVLEKDRATLDRENAALSREREALRHGKMMGKINLTSLEADLPETLERREKFIYLFERLIEKL